MKKTLKIITIVSIGLVSLYTFAQEHCNTEHFRNKSPKALMEKLDAKLDLNERQEKRVLTLLENRLEQHKALKQKMKAVRKEEKSKMAETMKSVLTEEQLVKFNELKAKRKAEFKANAQCDKGDKSSCHKAEGKQHKRMNPEQRLERLTKELDLSPRQQETLKNIFKEKREEMHKKYPNFRAEKQKLKSDFMKDMKAILSSEQFETFKTLKEDHHAKRKQMRKH